MQSNESIGKCVPEIGCLVNGLYLDGGAWCHVKNHLVESKNGILFDEMAMVCVQYNGLYQIGCYILNQHFNRFNVNRTKPKK